MRIAIRCVICALAVGLGACASARIEDQPLPAREIVSGGARLRGGGVRMDVQVGRAFTQRPARAGTATVKPAAVVTP